MPLSAPTTNALLDGLPARVRSSLLDQSEIVQLAPNQVLFGQAERINMVHFLTTAVVSLMTLMRNGTALEIVTIGREGTTGFAVALGTTVIPNASCMCTISGEAVVLPTDIFADAIGRHEALRDACLRYAASVVVQLGQRIACSRLHTTTQRCARWLLLTGDRVGRDDFAVTHEFLALVLGTRRATVSDSLARLAEVGGIRTGHGSIEIVNRRALLSQTCECYAVIAASIGQVNK